MIVKGEEWRSRQRRKWYNIAKPPNLTFPVFDNNEYCGRPILLLKTLLDESLSLDSYPVKLAIFKLMNLRR